MRAVVVGAARSGIAAAELLLVKGARVTLTEGRATFDDAERLAQAGVTLELGGHRAQTLAEADVIVVSPGVPHEQPVFDQARTRGVEIIGELELASRWIAGRMIAVTGTKGKSTTTTLIGRMLDAGGRRVRVGGNIGVPLSAQVIDSTPETIHVVEASSFQLETTTTLRPWIALWLNLADDHLDRHPSLDAYATAKARVFANQTADDWAVVNADDPVVMRHAAGTAAGIVTFSPSGSPSKRRTQGFLVQDDWIVRRTTAGVERMVPVSAVELAGRHMLGNVAAAAAVASVAGVGPEAMRAGLHGFRGLEHVMEPVGEVAGVRFVNDSKATNVEAALRSIESFPSGVVPIVGGHFKGGDLRDLRAAIARAARGVVAIGAATSLVHEALDGVVPVHDAASMREAVAIGFALASPADTVLLAPACASFDWFTDYAARGRAFKDAVEALRKERARQDV